VEVLSQKVYKDYDSTYSENIESFLTAGLEFFEEFVEQQQEELKKMKK